MSSALCDQHAEQKADRQRAQRCLKRRLAQWFGEVLSEQRPKACVASQNAENRVCGLLRTSSGGLRSVIAASLVPIPLLTAIAVIAALQLALHGAPSYPRPTIATGTPYWCPWTFSFLPPTIGRLRSSIQGDSISAMMKFLVLTVVLGLLVAGSAAFVSNHPRSLMACSSSCEQ